MVGFRILLIPALLSFLAGASGPVQGDVPADLLANSWPQEKCKARWWNGQRKRNEHRYDYSKEREFHSRGENYYNHYIANLNRRPVDDDPGCLKEWTVLVFMTVEESLWKNAMADLYEMEAGYGIDPSTGRSYWRGGSKIDSDLVVHFDPPEGRGELVTYHVQQTDQNYDRSLELDDFAAFTQEDIRSPIVPMYPEQAEVSGRANSNQPERLKAFLDWGMQAFPAENYAVVIWGHGQGWSSGNREDSSSEGPFEKRKWGGLAFDPDTQTYLDIVTLRGVLENTVRPIDVYISDACLMQNLEVAYELADSARFLIGSSQGTSMMGFPYRRIMYELNEHFNNEKIKLYGRKEERERLAQAGLEIDDAAFHMARAIPRLFKSSFDPMHFSLQHRHDPNAYKDLTASSISTQMLKSSLAPAVQKFSEAVVPLLKESGEYRNWLKTSLTSKNRVGEYLASLRELGDVVSVFQESLSRAADLKIDSDRVVSSSRAAEELRLAVNDAVVAQYFGPEYTKQMFGAEVASGDMKSLSVWIPRDQTEYRTRVPDFERSSFYKFPGNERERGAWSELMDEIFGLQIKIPGLDSLLPKGPLGGKSPLPTPPTQGR